MFPGKRRVFWPLLLFLLFLLVVASVGGCFASQQAVVATFTGGQVTEAELTKQFDFQRKLLSPGFADNNTTHAAFLQEYITLQRVLVAQAKQQGLKVDANKLKQEVADYKDQVTQLAFGGDASLFDAQLKKYGITDDDVTTLVANDDYLQQYKAQKTAGITVSANEVQTYYDQHKGQFSTGTISQILVKTEDDAKKAKARLSNGEDFSAVAKDVSIDPTVSLNGGTLKDVQFDMFQPEMRAAAATLTIGQISDPIQTTAGWQILRVDQRNVPPFAKVEKEVQQQALEDKQNQAWNSFYQETLQATQIQIHLPKS